MTQGVKIYKYDIYWNHVSQKFLDADAWNWRDTHANMKKKELLSE